MRLIGFAEDSNKWANGAPIYVDQPHGTTVFYLRRWGTPESEKVRKNIVKSLYGPMHNASDVDASEVYAHWLAEYGIASWEKIDEEDTAYNQRIARETFLNEEHFYSINQYLINQALNFENYLFDEAMEELENIKKS